MAATSTRVMVVWLMLCIAMLSEAVTQHVVPERGHEVDKEPHSSATDAAEQARPEKHDRRPKKLINPINKAATTYMLSSFRDPNAPLATLAELAAANYPAAPRQQAGRQSSPSARELEVWRMRQRLTRRRNTHPRHAPTHKATLDALMPQVEVAASSADGEAYAGAGPASGARLSVDGLNAVENNYANAQGVVSVDSPLLAAEPPDQGLCVGNGFVLETINTVMRVRDASTGAPLTPPLATNVFLGLPPTINTTGSSPVYGPHLVDPSCRYDRHTQRWFHVILRTNSDPVTGDAVASYLDVSVSEGADPRGYWRQYHIPASNNGLEGTPNFACTGSFCFPDFPQLAVWKDAVVISVNEFGLASGGFYGANVYALDKTALLAGAPAVTTALARTGNGVANTPASLDTLIPASQAGHSTTPNTYLMATPPARVMGWVNSLQLFSLLGTHTLCTPDPHVQLVWVERAVKLDIRFTTPPEGVQQRDGVNPLGVVDPSGPFSVSTVAALEGQVASVAFADDCLCAAWGTALQATASTQLAGVAWACVDPQRPAHAVRDGLLGLTGNNLVFPYLAVRQDGLGVMALTVVGPDYYPSAAYAVLSREGLGQLTVAAPGVGVVDGFTGYNFNDPRTPNYFGDYAAATVDERGAFWLGSQFIAQSCSVQQYIPDPTCGGTRMQYVNWATRITQVVVVDDDHY